MRFSLQVAFSCAVLGSMLTSIQAHGRPPSSSRRVRGLDSAPPVLQADTHTQLQTLVDQAGPRPVAVYFWTERCGFCHLIAPVFDAVAREYGDRAHFAKVNIRINPRSSRKYDVEGLPNFRFILRGKVVEQFRGASAEGLTHYLKKAIEKADVDDIELTREDLVTFFKEHDAEVAGSPESIDMLLETGKKSFPRMLDLLRNQYGAVPKYTGGFIRSADITGDSSAAAFKVGSKVRISGLKTEAAQRFNGIEGEVIGHVPSTGRWEVNVAGEVKALKPENLEPLASGLEDATVSLEDGMFQEVEAGEGDAETQPTENLCALFRGRAGGDLVERVVVLGGGPAGLSAALYAARANLCPLVVAPWGSTFGGQLAGKGVDVENYPGLPRTTGVQMIDGMRQQAEKFHADFRDDIAVAVDLSKRPFTISTNTSGEIRAETLIVATGASSRWLGVPGEHELRGHGVSGCATCDGYLHRGKRCLVVGGGDAALEDALHLTRICTSVTLVHRRNTFRAGGGVQARVLGNPSIAVRTDSRVVKFNGDPGSGLQGVVVEHLPTGAKSEIPVESAFVAIGHDPETRMFRSQLKMNEAGYLECEGRTMHTSVPGVFAAGDVADPRYRQAATSVGAGAAAALDAERWLAESPEIGGLKLVKPEDFSDWSLDDLKDKVGTLGLKCPGCKNPSDFAALLRSSF